MKTRSLLDSGDLLPLAHAEIVAYRRSSEAKFLDQNYIWSCHTAWAEGGQVVYQLKTLVQTTDLMALSNVPANQFGWLARYFAKNVFQDQSTCYAEFQNQIA